MTPAFRQLMEAESDVGLFLMLCSMMPNATGDRPLRTQLASLVRREQPVLCLSIRQAFRFYSEGQTILRWETIHQFTLDESATLMWERTGQAALIGVKAIQSTFRQLWEQGEYPFIESLSA